MDLTFSSDQKLSFRLSACLLLSLSVTKSSLSDSEMSLASVKKDKLVLLAAAPTFDVVGLTFLLHFHVLFQLPFHPFLLLGVRLLQLLLESMFAPGEHVAAH